MEGKEIKSRLQFNFVLGPGKRIGLTSLLGIGTTLPSNKVHIYKGNIYVVD